MRLKRCCALLLLPILASCGGENTVQAGPDPSVRSAVETGTLRGLRLLEGHGDVQFGLTRKPVVIADWQHVIFDPIRDFWVKSTLTQTSPEGGDGVSSLFISDYVNDFFVEESLTTPAGKRRDYSVQDEFAHTDTTEVTETLSQGPLAGYTYHMSSSMDMGTSEATVTITATHPSWGEMKTTGFGGFYNTTIKKDDKEDTVVGDYMGGLVTLTLSGGQKIELNPEEGTIKDSAGKLLATVTVHNGKATIHWETGETTTLDVWPTT